MSDHENTKPKSSDKSKPDNKRVDAKPTDAAKPAVPASEDKWDDYVIAEGRVVECVRGQLGGGVRIRKGDFDSTAFEMFKARGIIVKG